MRKFFRILHRNLRWILIGGFEIAALWALGQDIKEPGLAWYWLAIIGILAFGVAYFLITKICDPFGEYCESRLYSWASSRFHFKIDR